MSASGNSESITVDVVAVYVYVDVYVYGDRGVRASSLARWTQRGGDMAPSTRTAAPLALALLASACAHTRSLSAELSPLSLRQAALPEDHFRSDHGTAISEDALRGLLDAPVDLDDTQRLGVVPVSDGYRPEGALPLPAVPAELGRALESAALFTATTEVSTDWPVDSGLPGLRELAARYRAGYLLLYRHRFEDDSYANGWAWLYPTVVGAFLAPSRTLQTAGVLEATLFDVRTGTLVFTEYERVRASSDETPFADDRKLRAMKAKLLESAAGKLADKVVAKVRHLALATRARKGAEQAGHSAVSANAGSPASPQQQQ
jgi:hypothetical protein